jgi:hypothetical protein
MKKQDKNTGKHLTSGQNQNTTFSTLTPSEENVLKVLAKHKHIYDLYAQTGELVNFSADIHNEVINAYKEINPHYHYNRNCPACVCDMLKDVYNYYNKKI